MKLLTPLITLLLLLALLGGSCTRTSDPGLTPVANFTYRIDSTGWGERTLRLRNTSVNATRFVWLIYQPNDSMQYREFTTPDVDLVLTRNGPLTIRLAAMGSDRQNTKEANETVAGITKVGTVVFGRRVHPEEPGPVEVWIDKVYRGSMTQAYTDFDQITCGQVGCVTLSLAAGRHYCGLRQSTGTIIEDFDFDVIGERCHSIVFN